MKYKEGKYIIQSASTEGFFVKILKDGGTEWTIQKEEAKFFNNVKEAFDMGGELFDLGYDDLIIIHIRGEV